MANSRIVNQTVAQFGNRKFILQRRIYGEYDVEENEKNVAHADSFTKAVEIAEELAHGNDIHTCRHCSLCNVYHTENGAARYYCRVYKHSLDTLKPCVLWRDRE